MSTREIALRQPILSSNTSHEISERDSVAQLNLLIKDLEDTISSAESLHQSLNDLYRLLKDAIDLELLQNQYRKLNGFHTLLHRIEKSLTDWTDNPVEDRQILFLTDNVINLLHIVKTTLHKHEGNRRYFRTKIEPDGWKIIDHILKEWIRKVNLQLGHDTTSNTKVNDLIYASVFKALLISIFDAVEADEIELFDNITNVDQGSGLQLTIKDTSSLHITNSQLLLSLFTLCSTLSRHGACKALIQRTVGVVFKSVTISIWNINSLCQIDVLPSLLELADQLVLTDSDNDNISGILRRIISFGIHDTASAVELLKRAPHSIDLSQAILFASHQPKEPSCVCFDMSQESYAAIEVQSLTRLFPPSLGYSLSCWIYFDEFDDNNHTTLFGAFDSSQTCFVLVYVEKGSNQLILQTSSTASRPSVRFKKVRFEPNRWFHIVLLHRAPKSGTFGESLLFVNGRFVEKKDMCLYPSLPLSNTRNTNHTSNKHKVQAFFGTPQALAVSKSSRVRWRLSSAHLYDICISHDIIVVQHALGPSYAGNFQDRIGQLLTYTASAQLNWYNEQVNGEKSERSGIVNAVQRRGMDLLHENNHLLSILSHAVVDGTMRFSGYGNLEALVSSHALSTLKSFTASGNHVLINATKPNLCEALQTSSGISLLTGGAFVSIPRPIDNIMWLLGGFLSVQLSILRKSETSSHFLISLKTLLAFVRRDYRISEVMEREQGYGLVLLVFLLKLGQGTLISSSEGLWTDQNQVSCKLLHFPSVSEKNAFILEVFTTLLIFVGIVSDTGLVSPLLLENPLAYRSFLLDFDFLRTFNVESQALFYRQVSSLLANGPNRAFNAKRLARMRIARKLLDCLRLDVIYESNFDQIIKTLTSVCLHTAHKNDHKAILAFATFCLYDTKQPTASMMRPARRLTIRMDTRPTTEFPSITNSCIESVTTKYQIGSAILKIYAEILSTPGDITFVKRFHKIVPAPWLLHLLEDSDALVVASVLRIISRSITVAGPEFSSKLFSRSSGNQTLTDRISSHGAASAIWWICFATLFGCDIADIDHESQLSLDELRRVFEPGKVRIQHQESFHWIWSLLRYQALSIIGDRFGNSETLGIFESVIGYLKLLHNSNAIYRDLVASNDHLKSLLEVLFILVTDSPVLKPIAELNETISTPKIEVETITSETPKSTKISRPRHVRTATSITLPEQSPSKKLRIPRRASSFVLVNPADRTRIPLLAYFNPLAPTEIPPNHNHVETGKLSDLLLDHLVDTLLNYLFTAKDFSGFGLFLKVPPSDNGRRAFFESYILLKVMTVLRERLEKDRGLICKPRILNNIARYCLHMAEAVFEGWFIDGTQHLVEFTGNTLEILQHTEVANLDQVKSCSQSIITIQSVFIKLVLLRLSELDESRSDLDSVEFFSRLTYWQTALLSPISQELNLTKPLCYVFCAKLTSNSSPVRRACAGLFRMLLVQWSAEVATLFSYNCDTQQHQLAKEFLDSARSDDDEFLDWIDTRREALDQLLLRTLSTFWEEFVDSENIKTESSARLRLAKRRERLRQWSVDMQALDVNIQLANKSTALWRLDIQTQERSKLNRTVQDQHGYISNLHALLERQNDLLTQPCGLYPEQGPFKWQLDQTEARDRMRLRLLKDIDRPDQEYEPKRKASQRMSVSRPRAFRSNTSASQISINSARPSLSSAKVTSSLADVGSLDGQEGPASAVEDDYEVIDDIEEDKNRKIMQNIQRGDSIESIYNTSRIIGLEGCEGLLIIGKKCLYMRDNTFQRSDGEIVGIDNAPMEERDSYVQMIAGREVKPVTVASIPKIETSRSWAWKDVLSMSKRRFLLRDVAIELFFSDGQSYVLVFNKPFTRNTVYVDVASHASHIIGPSTSSLLKEQQWRLDCLRSPDEIIPSLGDRFGGVFGSTMGNSATKKWLKGEMSNFHYLMLINTMAGRTFNDLTQYPVFPWVLADYTSRELDLENSTSFRDLSKPMGCQTFSRESEFIERYNTFADMGEEKPFHYGTHYSSAMIVTSYLIRLQPFVQSHLLVQGGSFDHADRLFDSIGSAWMASSTQNMTDVRELVPEFYCLPEFLTNINNYDFGVKEGSGKVIGDVELPPWANNDPFVFIQKHREALESAYVSEHLHEWIDLIFGYKQKGPAAVEATNVFHPLSYHGAKDLDTIDDPLERSATIGIIHNFGQTPHQVFTKPHPQRDFGKYMVERLDTLADTLIKLPKPTREIRERIGSIIRPENGNKLIVSGPCRVYSPLPYAHLYVQWLYADNSLRFFDSETKKLIGLFEELHIGPISKVIFVDSKTLITAGFDGAIGLWDVTISLSDNMVDLRQKSYLFGHRSSITHLSVSKAFSTLVSASDDGRVIIWDVNRFDCLHMLDPTSKSPYEVSALSINDLTGHIIICRGPNVLLYTLNGHLILEQKVSDISNDINTGPCSSSPQSTNPSNTITNHPKIITACAFYTGTGSAEWVKSTLIFTAHHQPSSSPSSSSLPSSPTKVNSSTEQAVVKIHSLVILADGTWHLQLVKYLSHFSHDGIDSVRNSPSRRHDTSNPSTVKTSVYSVVGNAAGNLFGLRRNTPSIANIVTSNPSSSTSNSPDGNLNSSVGDDESERRDFEQGSKVVNPAAITCILPYERGVLCGDAAGRVWEWTCVLRQESHR